jgi:hypothetical protein
MLDLASAGWREGSGHEGREDMLIEHGAIAGLRRWSDDDALSDAVPFDGKITNSRSSRKPVPGYKILYFTPRLFRSRFVFPLIH